jgi:CRISPR system Cascade subunit CasA
MAHDLLHDPLITVTLRGGTRAALTLPGVLAALAADQIDDFCALRPHQEHPWYALLTQLAAIAADRAGHGEGPLPDDPAAWLAWLAALTPGAPSAWCLVADDDALPAFLQPGQPKGASPVDKPVDAPDGLDLLVLSKNHDLKASRARAGSPEVWLYALVSLQTMDGYPGRGNYGVARMNGGLGSRPLVASAPSLRWGARWRRDVPLLRQDDDAVAALGFDRGGVALLWLLPWDGTSSLPLAGLHPHFIEICRRVRLRQAPSGLRADKAPSTARRVDAEAQLGNIGDPWIPIVRAEAKAMTLGGGGYTYKQVARLLAGADFYLPAGAAPQRGDQLLLLSALVRGQGKTEGFHERAVPIPAGRFRSTDWRARLAAEVKRRIDKVTDARLRVLSFGLRTLLDAGEERGGAPGGDNRAQPHLDAFEERVEAFFFPLLWVAVDAETEAAERAAEAAFQEQLFLAARAQLEVAIASTPLPAARRYKAIAAAARAFSAAARIYLPDRAGAARPAADAGPDPLPHEVSHER